MSAKTGALFLFFRRLRLLTLGLGLLIGQPQQIHVLHHPTLSVDYILGLSDDKGLGGAKTARSSYALPQAASDVLALIDKVETLLVHTGIFPE